MPRLTPVAPMAKRKPAQRPRTGYKLHIFGTALALAIGLSLHSCAHLPAERELLAADTGLGALIKELGTAVREQAAPAGIPGTAPKPIPTAVARTDSATENFSACPIERPVMSHSELTLNWSRSFCEPKFLLKVTHSGRAQVLAIHRGPLPLRDRGNTSIF